ncbi:meiotic recombination protein SPO11 isoform X2 [Tachysurus fulvidraco]|uniref:meiotic recombination protein SPO11 isoform X2 n=1 Tax=Tachysurus fulvidraco TaxID=1234273 RepID=UPI001FEF5FDA|nr:meiotic recombination protein SPO11 isoform X2 [Tachysurus fulvidraco]
MSMQFTQVDILRAELLQNLEVAEGTVTSFSDIVSLEVVSRIEEVTQTIVSSLSKEEAPVFVFKSRSRWSNVRFNKSVGLYMQTGGTISTLRSDCPSSVIKFALIVKALSTIYKLILSDSYVTKREIFYNDPQLFGSQKTLDAIVDDVSCLLKVPRRSLHVCATTKGLISGDLCYMEEDGTRVDCSSTAVPVSSCVSGIMNIVSSAKFVLVIEKDATFQTLLDDAFCTQYYPCIIITSMAFEAPTLAVSSMLWLGLLPSDIESLRLPQDVLISLTVADERKLNHMKKRPYISCHPAWEREMELMLRWKQKAEIQSLVSIAPHFLTKVYLHNKLSYGGWI